LENRSTQIKSLRPDIGLENTEYHSAYEEFQNITLRPILKLQDAITRALLFAEKNFDSKIFHHQDHSEIKRVLAQFLQTNNKFRGLLIGCIVAMMTEEELAEYTKDRSQIDKRIISMQLERYMDNATPA